MCTSLTFVGGSKRPAMLIVTVFIFLRGKETFFFSCADTIVNHVLNWVKCVCFLHRSLKSYT